MAAVAITGVFMPPPGRLTKRIRHTYTLLSLNQNPIGFDLRRLGYWPGGRFSGFAPDFLFRVRQVMGEGLGDDRAVRDISGPGSAPAGTFKPQSAVCISRKTSGQPFGSSGDTAAYINSREFWFHALVPQDFIGQIMLPDTQKYSANANASQYPPYVANPCFDSNLTAL